MSRAIPHLALVAPHDDRDASLADVGHALGVTNQCISDLERRAIRKLWRIQVAPEFCERARIAWWNARHPNTHHEEV